MLSNLKISALLIILFSSLVIAPISITSASSTTGPQLDQSPGVINILTRHEPAIQESFREGFLASQLAADLGYSSGDKNKIVFWEIGTTQGWIKALERTGETAMDLAWGGGPPLFDSMAGEDYFSTVDDVDPTLVTKINDATPDEIAGVNMKRMTTDGELMWASNVISSFGFTVNRGVLENYGLDFPTKWIDLASPDFFVDEEIDVISMGNPPETTSNSRIYQIILQEYGWDRGWEIITSMAGNGGIFGGSLGTRAAVVDAQVAVGLTIDFYGVFTQNECATADRCEYVIPEDGSIINGDPMAIVKNRNNEEGAKAFLEYVFSSEGQALWISNDRLPVDARAFNTTLGLTRPDVKALYDKTLANQGIDFDDDLDLNTIETMKEYFESSITDVHDELKAAWAKIVTDFKDGVTTQTEFDAQITEFAKPQITLQQAIDMNDDIKSDSEFRYNSKLGWQDVASKRYDKIAGVSGGDDTPIPMVPVILSLLAMMIVTSILRKKRT